MISERCRKPPAGGLGVSPKLKSPKTGGHRGVDVDYFSTLYEESLPEGE